LQASTSSHASPLAVAPWCSRFVAMGNVPLATCMHPSEDAEFVPWPNMKGSAFWNKLEKQNIFEVLRQNGSLLQVVDVFPPEQAYEALEALKSVPEADWAISKTTEALRADHFFWRYSGNKVGSVRQQLMEIEPQMHPTIQAAKYSCGGKISLHNDADSWVLSFPETQNCSPFSAGTRVYRKVALIYYLTKDWQEDYGGCLVDNLKDGQQVIVPRFNSLIAFLVPREHLVTEMKEDAPYRYTIFGWLSDREPYPPGIPVPLGSGNRGFKLDSDDEETDEGDSSCDGQSVDSS